MAGLSRQLMRLVLVALLFQFLSPAFFTVMEDHDQQSNGCATAIHAHYNTLAIPQLLKEKDETEFKTDDILDIAGFIPLLDFSAHSFVLAQLHTIRFRPFNFSDRIDQHPPLFTLYSSFII
ncbi:hypothetical protein [Ohtaekwangia sp.]|uniref:hypothetical protein n=1 Tax=Ohtaekwangia sp. TaxID=2066019 RepID=UPI002FDECF5A